MTPYRRYQLKRSYDATCAMYGNILNHGQTGAREMLIAYLRLVEALGDVVGR